MLKFHLEQVLKRSGEKCHFVKWFYADEGLLPKLFDGEFHKHCQRSVTFMGKKACNVTRGLFLSISFFQGVQHLFFWKHNASV